MDAKKPQAEASPTLFELRGVGKNFVKGREKITIFDNLDMSIRRGEFLAIMGPSGSGKTTLLNMLGGVDQPTTGEIRFDGQRIDNLSENGLAKWRAANIGFIFQFYNLMPMLSAARNVELPLLLTNLSKKRRSRNIDAALELVDLKDRAGHKPREMSGGQQQRVAIARALMQQPKVILADEPIASLDPRNAQIVMQSLADINRNDGITVITNLHTLDTARAYCERIIGMSGGEVVFDGTPDDLTEAAARRIYGADALEEAFSEAVTSTSFGAGREKIAPKPEPEVVAARP